MLICTMPTGKLTSLHFHAWKSGLKTGMYYLRTRAAADAIKFTVDQQALARRRSERASKGPAPEEPADVKVCGEGSFGLLLLLFYFISFFPAQEPADVKMCGGSSGTLGWLG